MLVALHHFSHCYIMMLLSVMFFDILSRKKKAQDPLIRGSLPFLTGRKREGAIEAMIIVIVE